MANIIAIPLATPCQLHTLEPNHVSFCGTGDSRQVDILITNGSAGELEPLRPLLGEDVIVELHVRKAA